MHRRPVAAVDSDIAVVPRKIDNGQLSIAERRNRDVVLFPYRRSVAGEVRLAREKKQSVRACQKPLTPRAWRSAFTLSSCEVHFISPSWGHGDVTLQGHLAATLHERRPNEIVV